MIYGIGTDIIEIDRIKKSYEKNPKLLNKLFSDREIQVLEKKKFKPQSIAGMFCAKEAIVKSVGTGLRNFSIKDLEILRNNLNKPVVIMTGAFKEFCDEEGIENIMVSISHSINYATATAIAEKK
ncbi:holo-ACP synthase [Peptostreptococcus equinus]|uniref:Holo-[acyl-carrier-protein] synthase n=1 Tax=Peptostreptococcus equinus TaxID=3003601 RepID=A0ABY7JQA8_9FIRM|nr:holo-ACP synthase [Peptostreptococcus sp. CBA3647]WAW15081.1 holo-ACP synthase [Peptostreptococcus sp. CBA3647]